MSGSLSLYVITLPSLVAIGSGDMLLVCHMISQDHDVKGSKVILLYGEETPTGKMKNEKRKMRTTQAIAERCAIHANAIILLLKKISGNDFSKCKSLPEYVWSIK